MVAKVALWGAVLSTLVANNALAQTVPVIEAGARQSSALVQSGGQATILLNQIDTLQQEVMELRGLVEQQTYAIEQIQKEGRDRYLDLDRRVSHLVKQMQSTATASVTANPANPSARPAATSAASGETDYQNAFQAVRNRRFADAVSGLTTYLQKYPKGTHADSAEYWLGEIYLLQESFDKAEVAFSRLVTQFPKSDKYSDALYKLGQVNDRLGNDAKAKSYLQRVIKEYPNTTSARLADVYLTNIEG